MLGLTKGSRIFPSERRRHPRATPAQGLPRGAGGFALRWGIPRGKGKKPRAQHTQSSRWQGQSRPPHGLLLPAQPSCPQAREGGKEGQKPAAQCQPPLAHPYPEPVITSNLGPVLRRVSACDGERGSMTCQGAGERGHQRANALPHTPPHPGAWPSPSDPWFPGSLSLWSSPFRNLHRSLAAS